MNESITSKAETGDFVRLGDADEYAKYFLHISRVFRLLSSWYEMIPGGDDETAIMSKNLDMLLATVQALRLRQLHDPSRNLALDLNESGFPHSLGIENLSSDLTTKEERLSRIIPARALRQQMLDYMVRERADPAELLTVMGERQYFESLDKERLFLPFNRGEIIVKAAKKDFLECVVWWSCYDSQSSRPYIYILGFTYDQNAEALEKGNSAYDEFWEVIQQEGSRAPTCLVVAAEIDRRITAVHPKILKRVCPGPILAKAFAKDRNPLLEVVRVYGEAEDFAAIITSEVVFSKAESRPKGGFFRKEKIRQVFAVSDTDNETYIRQVSSVSHRLLIPHHILQQMDFDNPALKRFASYSKIAFNKNGEIFQL